MAARRRPQRGVALIIVFVMAAVFLIVLGTIIDALAMESHLGFESAASDAAINAAYAGIDEMTLTIEEFDDSGVQNGHLPTNVTCSFQDPQNNPVTTSCTASITNSWNATGLNYYLIQSTGTANDFVDATATVNRTVDALVQQIPFGAYARYTENDRSNTGGVVWYSSGQTYNGPVYSGGPMHIRYDKDCLQNDPPCPAIFPDGFTTAQSPVWFNAVNGQYGPPCGQCPKDQLAVFGGTGSETIDNSQQQLPGFAQNLVAFSEAFYGDASHATSTDPAFTNPPDGKGVYVNGTIATQSGNGGNIASGIFIDGDVDVQASGVPGTDGNTDQGSQTFVFTGPPGDPNGIPGQVTVTINFQTPQSTMITENGSTVTYSGVPSGDPTNTQNTGNGSIFDEGDITFDQDGTIHGQYTFAAPDPPTTYGGDTITLEDSLTYATSPGASTGSEDELALWADDIWLKTQESDPTIDAMILTGYANECSTGKCADGFFANAYCNSAGCPGGGSGNATFFGSLIQNVSGKMGELNGQSQLIGGFLRQDQYDPRLGADPPPSTPETNDYKIVAIQNEDGYTAP